jgi:pseudo-rSAM protein
MDIKQKFFLNPYIYYTVNPAGKLLLYNTKTGANIVSYSCICRELIEDVYNPANLGVIDLTDKYLNHPDAVCFIEQVVEKDFGKVIDIAPDMPKIINLLPVLNLQDDVERLKDDDESDVGEKSLRYLNELNIYLNNLCDLDCLYCPIYYKQSKSCYKGNPNTLIPYEIKRLLDSLVYSSLKRIDFLGGNILLYPYLNELIGLLKNYDFDFHFWIDIENLMPTNHDFDIIQDVTMHFPIDIEAVKEYISMNKNDRQTYHFFIEDEEQYNVATSIIESAGVANYQIIPVYTGKNITFFEKNIYLSEEDIFVSPIPHRIIFCNQKLNSNHFGKLYVLSNGEIKANINAPTLGNIYTNSLLEVIAAELNANTAWRVFRKDPPCNDCLYQYLCPPPSNYEIVTNKPNLCHVRP